VTSPVPSSDSGQTDKGATQLPEAVTARFSNLDRTSGLSDASANSDSIEANLAIPGYHLMEVIARGGMGVVWRAHDVRLNREVAIKMVRADVIGKESAIERFVAEAQITAQLQHPGIPAVHELGQLADGRPFLAMKLVRGRTLNQLLKERHFDINGGKKQDCSRFLGIFEQICHAVGYAHTRQVIHRDLKPANVMVGTHGEVQVMDWGLAKILAPDAAPKAASDLPIEPQIQPYFPLHLREVVSDPEITADLKATTDHRSSWSGSGTVLGSVLGTPAYMPPEQARGEINRLDPRSDVFGLGAILYEILVGRPIYQANTIKAIHSQALKGPTAEILKALDDCGAEAALISLCRRCLAIDPSDRLAHANEVAEQVARIRAEATERARQAELDRAQAEVREAEQRKRRRQMLVAATTITLILSVGLIVSLWQMQRAVHAEAIAKLNQEQAEARRIEADEERRKAEQAAAMEKAARLAEERERKYAQAIANFVKEDFLALTSVEGQVRFDGRGLDRNSTLIDLINRAAERLQKRKDLDPRIEAELCWIIGINYRGMGETNRSIPFLERSLELRQQVLGPHHHDTLNAQNSLAVAYQTAGRFDLAIPLLETTLTHSKTHLGPHHPHTLTNMTNLAAAYLSIGQVDKALALFEEAISLQKTHLGPGHPITLSTMNNFAMAYQALGQLDRARALYEETFHLRKVHLGTDHPATITSMNNLATVYQDMGQLDEAIALLNEALRLREDKLGFNHPETLATLHNLACAHQSAGHVGQAIPLFEDALKRKKDTLGTKHPTVLPTLVGLALAYKTVGDFEKSLPLLDEAIHLAQSRLGPEHLETLTIAYHAANTYREAGRNEKALPLYELAARGVEKLRYQHIHAQDIILHTIRCYEEARKLEEALTWRRKWLSHLKATVGKDSSVYTSELAQLGQGLCTLKRYCDAEQVLRECLAMRAKKEPDAWTTFNTLSLLGQALLGQKKYAEAEPLLLKGYEGLKARRDSIPPEVRAERLAQAVDALIELYTATNQSEHMTKWQAEKAKLLEHNKR
jgi:serine/threonine protein kinase